VNLSPAGRDTANFEKRQPKGWLYPRSLLRQRLLKRSVVHSIQLHPKGANKNIADTVSKSTTNNSVLCRSPYYNARKKSALTEFTTWWITCDKRKAPPKA
jgi:hypothetical protein